MVTNGKAGIMHGIVSDLALSGLHILVVEDEYFLASALVRDLEQVGAVPIGPSPSVFDALKRISESERIDAALLNFRLRGELSIPIAEDLRRRGIPFVFVTGNDEDARERFPGVRVHPKPADMAAIVRTLAAVVAER